jgi:hypothetical protein
MHITVSDGCKSLRWRSELRLLPPARSVRLLLTGRSSRPYDGYCTLLDLGHPVCSSASLARDRRRPVELASSSDIELVA